MPAWASEAGDVDMGIVGLVVASLCVDYQFRLNLAEDRPHGKWVAEIVIEAPFMVGPPGGSIQVDPFPLNRPADRSGLGVALNLHPRHVLKAVAHANGRLELAFTDGWGLSVDPSPPFEAWQILGPRPGSMWLCLPSGGLEYFPGDQAAGDRTAPESLDR